MCCSSRLTSSLAWRVGAAPRGHLTGFHGILAPNARHRRLVVPAPPPAPADDAETTPSRPRASMTWTQRLRRVFAIDLSRCPRCGAPLRVLAVITDPRVIAAILAHIETRAARAPPPARHQPHALPAAIGGALQARQGPTSQPGRPVSNAGHEGVSERSCAPSAAAEPSAQPGPRRPSDDFVAPHTGAARRRGCLFSPSSTKASLGLQSLHLCGALRGGATPRLVVVTQMVWRSVITLCVAH
jgi:hypothetical protein